MSKTIQELMADRAAIDHEIALLKQSDKQVALEEIGRFVESAYASIREAESLARKHGVEFDFGLEYGMGGTYNGRDWQNSDSEDARNGQWQSSSSQC